MKREQEYHRLTGEQKDAIRVLWSNGWGSKKIARYMGLNLDTVKSHCRRHLQEHGVPRGGLGETWGICKNCNKIITYTPNKKKKEFCSDSCRYAWWRAHNKPSEKEGDAHATFICQQCGNYMCLPLILLL